MRGRPANKQQSMPGESQLLTFLLCIQNDIGNFVVTEEAALFMAGKVEKAPSIIVRSEKELTEKQKEFVMKYIVPAPWRIQFGGVDGKLTEGG